MKVGIIGGSGLYEMKGIRDARSITVETPFGPPSDAYVHGMLGDVEVIFLSRHGRGHRIMPSELNHRANIYGFKTLGVERIAGVSAVGSLREDLRPRDIVLPDQYFDRTTGSLNHTFFGNGIVAHVSLAEPVCPELRGLIRSAAAQALATGKHSAGARVHDRGTYVNMEGPAFSTKAESAVYRKLGFDIIGMTSLAEAKLCREAEICYSAMCLVTDYDCWHESEAPVTVEMVLGNLNANTALAQEVLRNLLASLPPARACSCGHALENTIITDPKAIPDAAKKTLAPIIGKYVK
jgi:5'-methylthioadenosine phosphorylase